MRRVALWALALWLALPLAAWAHERTLPGAWHLYCSVADEYQAGVTDADSHAGTWCAYLKSGLTRPKGFATVNQSFKAEHYRGKKLRCTAWVKAIAVGGEASFWLRVDGSENRVVGYAEERHIKGTGSWKAYAVTVDVPADGEKILAGFNLADQGTLCFDDVKFNVVTPGVKTARHNDFEH